MSFNGCIGAGEVFKYTFPAPEKPGKYLKTPFRRLRSICTHLSGAEEVLIYTYLAPERPEKAGEAGEAFIYTGFNSFFKLELDPMLPTCYNIYG